MNNETIKSALLLYLRGRDWTYGGTICRDLGPALGHKEAVIERHGLRSQLVKGDNSLIEKRYVDNPNGKGAKVLQYRLRPQFKVIKESGQLSFA